MQRILSVVLSGIVLAGCGASGVREVHAPRQRVRAPVTVREFEEPRDQTLLNNKVFLWEYGMQDVDVSTALKCAQRIDQLEIAQGDANRELDAAKASEGYRVVEAARKGLVDAKQASTQARVRVNAMGRALQAARTALEQARRRGDTEAVTRLEADVADKDARVKTAQSLQTQAEEQAVTAESDLKQIEIAKREAVDLVTVKQGKVGEVLAHGEAALKDLAEVVELDEDGPTVVRFDTRADGQLAVYISQWPVGNLKSRGISMPARNFSTDDGTITNARYERTGGRIEFDVTVYVSDTDRNSVQARYHFKLARNEYDKTDNVQGDGRIFYTGDVWRESALEGPLCSAEEVQATGCRRKGSAKFVSKNSPY